MSASEQARADAMADAETLINGWWSAGSAAPFVHEPLEAVDHGLQVVHRLVSGWADEITVYFHARMAARAAFRACPGLRGDA